MRLVPGKSSGKPQSYRIGCFAHVCQDIRQCSHKGIGKRLLAVICLPNEGDTIKPVPHFLDFDVVYVKVLDRERFGKHGTPLRVRVPQRDRASRSRLSDTSHKVRDVHYSEPAWLASHYVRRNQVRDSINSRVFHSGVAS